MSPPDAQTLRQILEHGRRALELARRSTRANLEADWVAAFALEKALEIVGEAVRRLSPGLKEQHGEIPWVRIVGLRNELVHRYDKIDLDRLWAIVNDDLPVFLQQVERILRSAEP